MANEIKTPVRAVASDAYDSYVEDATGRALDTLEMANALNAHADLKAKCDAMEAVIREALEPGVFGIQDRTGISAPEDAMVRRLGEHIGFGALMDAASRMWRLVAIEKGLDGSEFTTGPCRAIKESWVAKAFAAMESEQPTGD